MNGPLKFLTARKSLLLLDLLAKFKQVFACPCSPSFNSVWRLIPMNMAAKFSGNARDK